MNLHLSESKDHFSQNSNYYAKYRPTYPCALIDFICSASLSRSLAWDCATGNGQVAIALADHFERVLATDISQTQIANASLRSNLYYQVCRSEETPFHDNAMDLVTVAEALHWFNLPLFYNELSRILKPGGLFACWSYGNGHINESIDFVINEFKEKTLDTFWPREARTVDVLAYPMPEELTELHCPKFFIEVNWDYWNLIGYLYSWSAVSRFKTQTGQDPVVFIQPAIQEYWQKESDSQKTNQLSSKKIVRWPLSLRIARKPG